MKKFLSLILITALVACGSEAEFNSISQQQLLANDKAGSPQLILDVRSAEEFAEGHVANAINIDYQMVAAKLQQIETMSNNQQIPIIVYCRSGRRAELALNTLDENGFINIFHLEGDMNGWQQAKLPVVK